MAGFQLRSPAIADGTAVPVRHTCDGEDLSPPLLWSGAPAGAHVLATAELVGTFQR